MLSAATIKAYPTIGTSLCDCESESQIPLEYGQKDSDLTEADLMEASPSVRNPVTLRRLKALRRLKTLRRLVAGCSHDVDEKANKGQVLGVEFEIYLNINKTIEANEEAVMEELAAAKLMHRVGICPRRSS